MFILSSCCLSNFRPWTRWLLLLWMMLLQISLFSSKPLGLVGIVTVPVTWRKVCEYVCFTVSLPTSMHWLLLQAYGPECRHHTTHNHATKKKKKKAKKHTNCPLCFLEFINSILAVLSTVLGVVFIKIKKKNNWKSRKGACFWTYQSKRDTFTLVPQRLLWMSSVAVLFCILSLKLPSHIYL